VNAPGSDPREALKRRAGEKAAALVSAGMVVGLGTGSTAVFATRAIGAALASGALRDVSGVPTSRATAEEARRVGIPLLSDDIPRAIDVTIDGADEVDPALDLIKGGGGALFREKIVAQASGRLVIVVDASKLSPALGTRHALPVEVARFGWKSQERFLESIGGKPKIRLAAGGAPYETDQGNWILDCAFGPIADAPALARRLEDRAGIVAHGLFCHLATEVIVAADDGILELKRS
jgi:ribose 5-phosphate isomerase A